MPSTQKKKSRTKREPLYLMLRGPGIKVDIALQDSRDVKRLIAHVTKSFHASISEMEPHVAMGVSPDASEAELHDAYHRHTDKVVREMVADMCDEMVEHTRKLVCAEQARRENAS